MPTRFGCCFFFQAEDGIRDDLVTGVQTCALPISAQNKSIIIKPRRVVLVRKAPSPDRSRIVIVYPSLSGLRSHAALENVRSTLQVKKIGRASCRERVYV